MLKHCIVLGIYFLIYPKFSRKHQKCLRVPENKCKHQYTEIPPLLPTSQTQNRILSRHLYTLSCLICQFKRVSKMCSCYLGKYNFRQGSCNPRTCNSKKGTNCVPSATTVQLLQDYKGMKCSCLALFSPSTENQDTFSLTLC